MASVYLIVLAKWDTYLFRRLTHCYNNWLLSFVLPGKKNSKLKSLALFYLHRAGAKFIFFSPVTEHKTDLTSFTFARFAIAIRNCESCCARGDLPNKPLYRWSVVCKARFWAEIMLSTFIGPTVRGSKWNFEIKKSTKRFNERSSRFCAAIIHTRRNNSSNPRRRDESR